MIAFVWDGKNRDNFDIYVKLVDAGSAIRLTTDPRSEYSPVWSPDGRYIAFGRVSEEHAGFYVVPSLGGPERRLDEVEIPYPGMSTLDWSPDGKYLAIVDEDGPSDKTGLRRASIFLLSIENREKTRLTFPNENGSDDFPSFSPDGHTLAFTRWSSTGSDIYLVPVTGGEPTRLTFTERCLKSGWTANGREILFGSLDGDVRRIWRIPALGGRPEPLNRVNIGLAPVWPSLSVSRQGNRLAYAEGTSDRDIWRIELPASQDHRAMQTRLISSSRSESTPQISPDGKKIAFTSDRSGKDEIWVCDSDGRNPQQLTFSPEGVESGTPRWSPDGRYIVYGSGGGPRGTAAEIHVISAEGGSPRLVTDRALSAYVASWSRDGRWIYFCSGRSGQIWRVPASGGQAVQLTKKGGVEAFESADRKFVYYSRFDTRTYSDHIWKMPVEGAEEIQVFDEPIQMRQWALAENGIYFIPRKEIHRPLLKFFSFDTSRIIPIARLEKDSINGPYSGLAVSPDGRWLLCPLTEQNNSDVMLVENFQ
jgi:Tol biopolymer transport system component